MKRIAKAALLILGALSVVAAIMVYQDENISRDEYQRWRLEHNQRFEQDFKERR